ncbi:MAG: TonB-dependent receptor [Cellvibrio sp.]|uniref:TonB-dependent receptor family protein n=1 Tax=Cellvibrio sp. TaxID=1965322 RepID=UPI00271D4936|nr:TonB-dependent receptor [Cellvibrio sp.]
MIYSRKNRVSLLVGAMLAAQTDALHAQMAPEVLETLIVSGERSASSELSQQVLIKTADDFAVGARLDPAELLQLIPGVQVDSRTNYAQDTRISLRGFGARSAFGVRGIDLQVDGIPMSTPDGQGQLASAMLDNIASVQVLRGPIAGLYGNGAGGVIALQTAVPEASNISAGLIAGDPGLARQTLIGEWRSENLAMRAQFANTDIDGERPHSSAERQQTGVQLFYTTENNLDVIVKHDYSDDPLLQDPLGLTPEQWRDDSWQANSAAETYDTRKTVEHQQTSISLRDNTGATRWQTGLWQGERAITQYLGFAGDAISGSGGVIDLQRDFSGINGTITRSLNFFSWPAEISFGAELAQMQDDRRGYVNDFGTAGDLRRDETGEVESRDIYSLIHFNPSEKLMLYTGVRQTDLDFDVEDKFIVAGNPDDSGSRDYRENSFAIGGNYAVTSAWELFASSGRGYETPTLTEMAYKTGATGLNTELAAATNRQHEWGIGYHPDEKLELTLTQFSIDTENEIVVDQSVGGRTTFRNAAETEREGIEFFGRYAVNSQVRVQLAIQSLDAIYSAGQWSGNQLPGVAREQYQLGVQWLPFTNDVLQLDLVAQQRSRIYTADSNQVYAPDYYTFDVGARGTFPVSSVQFDWWLKLANLSDENYVGSVIVNQANGRAFEPALGRNVTAGIKLTHQFD